MLFDTWLTETCALSACPVVTHFERFTVQYNYHELIRSCCDLIVLSVLFCYWNSVAVFFRHVSLALLVFLRDSGISSCIFCDFNCDLLFHSKRFHSKGRTGYVLHVHVHVHAYMFLLCHYYCVMYITCAGVCSVYTCITDSQLWILSEAPLENNSFSYQYRSQRCKWHRRYHTVVIVVVSFPETQLLSAVTLIFLAKQQNISNNKRYSYIVYVRTCSNEPFYHASAMPIWEIPLQICIVRVDTVSDTDTCRHQINCGV